ncbi:MAG: hypothetical protein DCC49_05955 [Acidobacteria bacterium]|nr:MAG: hypothetical protein DCC49_05955 [Acidobacteriota bacterium]
MNDRPVEPDSELRDLVAAAQIGDGQALAALYDAFSDRVYRYALVILRDHEAAEDVTSDVFLGVLRNIGSFQWRQGSTFESWVFRIAHNVIVDEKRRLLRRPTVPLAEEDEMRLVSPADIEDSVIDAVELRDAWRNVAGLPKGQRRVLELRLVAGLSAEETGEVLGKSAGAVRVLQHRALTTLREMSRVPQGAGDE